MSFWCIFFAIIGIVVILIIIFGFPRKKKSPRKPNIEGLDNPEVAKAFEKMTNFLPFRLLRKKVISKLKDFHPKGTLVDIGCGSGNLIIQIAESFPDLNLIGIDIASEILEFAKKRALDRSLGKRIEFKIGNVEKLPFSNESIDFIISTFSLHHWVNPLKGFNEIHRVLKRDGTLLIFDFRRDSRRFFYGFLTFITKVVAPKALKEVHEPLGSIQSSYAYNEIFQLISQTSFQIPKVKTFLAWMFISIKK
ncbi:2-methoxy-6-polyprenyl-1,4-benzoquinol methylase, mitochondrial [subsurface metagenome]